MRAILLLALFLALNVDVIAQSLKQTDLVFNPTPWQIPFENHLSIDTLGGHLQGVQSYFDGQDTYYFLSGSSNFSAYLVVIKQSDTASVEQILPLMSRPYKHAGGFQIYDHYLAIGIEDNEARNTSKILIFDARDLVDGIVQPIQTIHRDGPYERATAGCAGLTFFQEGWLLAVGDWDSRNLDIYQNPNPHIGSDSFVLVQSISLSKVDRTDWSDASWLPYQNINLFVAGDQLIMAGLTSVATGDNVVDLYFLEISSTNSMEIQKFDQQHLGNTGGDFISAAGILNHGSEIQGVMSTPRNLRERGFLYFYRSKEDQK